MNKKNKEPYKTIQNKKQAIVEANSCVKNDLDCKFKTGLELWEEQQNGQ